MQINLTLTLENQLELALHTDKYYTNPDWAVTWTQTFIPSSFCRTNGSLNITDLDQMLLFLKEWIKRNNNSLISSRDFTAGWVKDNIAITNVEKAKLLESELNKLLKNGTIKDGIISPEKFNRLKTLVNTNNPKANPLPQNHNTPITVENPESSQKSVLTPDRKKVVTSHSSENQKSLVSDETYKAITTKIYQYLKSREGSFLNYFRNTLLTNKKIENARNFLEELDKSDKSVEAIKDLVSILKSKNKLLEENAQKKYYLTNSHFEKCLNSISTLLENEEHSNINQISKEKP